MPLSRILMIALASASLLVAQTSTQNTAAPPAQASQPTTFHAQTELVTIPVVVERGGQHVTGLKQADFTVEENGHKRDLASFEEVTPSATGYQLPPQPAAQYTNFIPPDQGVRRINIVVLDLLNSPFSRQWDTRRKLMKFLAEHVNDPAPTSLLALNGRGLRQIHSFTTDTNDLIAALKKVETTMSVQDQEAAAATVDPESSNPLDSTSTDPATQAAQLLEILQERADAVYNVFRDRTATLTTLRALEQIAEAYTGVPGRKSLIWATGGLPFVLNDPDSITGMDTSMQEDYARTWRALNSANIAVYPIDVNGLTGPDLSRRGMQGPNRPVGTRPSRGGLSAPTPNPINPVQNAQDSMKAFAHETGGRACYNNNDLAECFAHAASDSSQYYLLSYYLPSDDRKPGWHKLKVQVAAQHVEVRARDGFFVGSDIVPKEHSLIQQFDNAAASPIDYTSVPIGVRIKDVTTAPSGEQKVSFVLTIAPNGVLVDTGDNNHAWMDIAAVAGDEKGRLMRVFGKVVNAHLKPESLAMVQKAGIGYSDVVTLPAGSKITTLRFMVRDDATGKLGTITTPLEAGPHSPPSKTP